MPKYSFRFTIVTLNDVKNIGNDCTEIFDNAKKNPEQLKIEKDRRHTQKDMSRTSLLITRSYMKSLLLLLTLAAILAFCPSRAGLHSCNSIQQCLSGYTG